MSEKKQLALDSHPLFSPLTEQTKDDQQDYTHAEFVEAKTAVILLNSAAVFKKNEYIHWRLTSMFRPMAIGEKTESMEVLYLSHQRKHNWLSEYKNDDSNNIMMSAPSAPLSSTLFRHPLQETLSTRQKKQLLYVLTPRTNVITLSKICRLVYMMDLSSSLATVGNTKSQILLLEVFKALRNSLEGIVHPFCLQISTNERIMIRPVLRLTVIADCSQFASNINVIPMLTNHPSMRVFIQNVQITLENVDHIISDLYSAFILFQKDTAIHRKQMKRKRSSMGYDLEVDEGPVPSYERSVFDATSLPASMGVENGPSYAKASASTTTTTSTSRKLKRKPKSFKSSSSSSSSSSSVWGMGKTGANLTRMLHAGAFALSLLPEQGRSQLILVSDGALKSHIHDNTVARQLAEQDVACHVIQIGFNQSFIPGRNFGFLPDVDTLKFLAQATGGTFLYSDECVRLTRPDHDPADKQEKRENGGSNYQQQQQQQHHHHYHHHRFIQSSIMKKQKGSTIDEEMENANIGEEHHPHHHRRRRRSSGESNAANEKKASSTTLQDDWWWNLDPNIYHRHFVLRESNLEKIRTLTPFHPRHYLYSRPTSADHESAPSTENGPQHHQLRLQQGNSGFISLTNFPWDPQGTTPPIEWRLLRYREYALPQDFAPMIAARAREGFYLQSVLFDTKSVLTASSSSSSSSDIHDKSNKKKKRKPTINHDTATTAVTSSEERIQITLVLYWKPHIIIEYRIRATWLPMRHQQEEASWGTLFSRATSPQVEVFIRCDAEFAHLLQNWTSLRRRAQMMMVMAMTGGSARDTNKNQLFFKGEPQAAQAYASIEKLKTYLQCLFEGDDLLRDWIDPKHDHFSPWLVPHQEKETKGEEEEEREPDIQLLEARFRSFWFSSRFSAEESRALTRCWYDLDCIDMLVGDVSPYMDPKLESAWNQDFGPHVQETIQQSMTAVVKILKTAWADFELTREKKKEHDHEEVEDGVVHWFVKLIQKSDSEDTMYSVPSLPTTTTSSSVASSSSSMTIPMDSEKSACRRIDWQKFKLRPTFCQLKVKHEYGRLITLRFLFFNVDATLRQDVKTQVMNLLEENALLKNTSSRSDLICTRPLSRLLIRDDEHFEPNNLLFPSTQSCTSSESENEQENDGSKKKSTPSLQKVKQTERLSGHQIQSPSPSLLSPLHQQYQQKLPSPSWYLPVGLWLTGEHIVHDYLLHSIWSWQTDNYQDAYHQENKMMPVHDLAFQLLCQARLDQGYQLVLPRPDNTHFYQEITFPQDSLYVKRHHHRHQKGRKTDPLCAIQYFIRKDNTNSQGRIITELWVEPSVHHINRQDEEDEEEDDDDDKGSRIDQVAGKWRSDYDWIKTWTEVPDRRIISHLVTFDQIHAIGRTKGKGDFKPPAEDKAKKDKEDEDEVSECTNDAMVKMLLPYLFDVSSVLKTNDFALVSYDIPSYRPEPACSDNTEKCIQGSSFSNAASILLVRDFLALPVQYQPYCMLHHYFERALQRNVMDGEVVMSQHNPRSKFWSALKKAIRNYRSSNISHVTCLKQVKCYVSIIDPRSFLIVLIPDLNYLMATFRDADIRQRRRLQPQEENAPDRFDCLFFECTRQKPLRTKKQTDDTSDTSNVPLNKRYRHDLWLPCLLDDNYDDDYGNDDGDDENRDGTLFRIHPTIQPNLPFLAFLPDSVYCGHLQKKHTTTTPIKMSEKSQMFLYKVTESYAQAFLRAIYSFLLTHTLGELTTTPPLPLPDLMKAVSICHTTVISIDIVRFVNIMACPSISLCDDMDQKWKMTLNPYFKPIKVIEIQQDVSVVTDIADILIYIPPSLMPSSSTEPAPFPLDIETPPGQHPLFLGVNIMSDDSDMTPLCEDPTSFDQLKKIMVAFSDEEYEDEDTFLAKAFPTDQGSTETSSTPRLTLNLVCKSIAVDNQSNTRRSSASKDQVPVDTEENDSYLTNEQTVILSETVSKIEWAFTEQVLHGLLILQKKQQETKKEMLHYVVTELGKSYANTNHYQQTKFQVPLSFVSNDSQLCINLFMDLFEKSDKDVDDKVDRLDPYFHIIWSPLTLWAAAIATTDNDTTVEEIPMDGSGLGISMEEDQEEEKKEPQVPDSYWLVAAVHLCHVDIFYFAICEKANPSTLVVDHTIDYVRKIEKQTNQKLLLDMLQETRVCSKYLEAPPTDIHGGIPSSDSDSSHDSGSSGESKSSVEATDLTSTLHTGEKEATPSRHHHLMHFEVGQFQCPLVYRKEFPLHWRVPLGKALHYLKSDLLRPFIVTNRADMYVIEREKAIVYCKLNEKLSPSMINKDETDTPQLLSTTTAASNNELEMSVYGLECPDWIVQDVVTLIENRLASEVTLDELQTFFSRNPTSKPTISDVLFILPFDKRQPETKILRLPQLISDSSLLLRFFKRFLLAEGLKSFKGPHVISAITNASTYLFEDDENQDQSDRELQKDDLCFYYNCTKRIPGVSSSLELSCGQGMAGICMTLRDQQGRIMTTLRPKDTTKGFNFDPDDIRQSLDIELNVASIENDHYQPYYVWVDVWTMGSVDAQILLQRIRDCYRRALCDYLIEETVTIDLGSVLLYEAAALQQAVNSDRAQGFTSSAPSHRQLSTLLRKKFITSIVYMLQKSVEWENPTVHAMKEPTKNNDGQWMMPPWCMKDIISHLDQELVLLDPSLEPTITWKKLGNQYDSPWNENDGQDNDDISSEWLLYRGGPVFCRNNIQNNIRVVAISGLSEFVEQFGGASSSPATHFSPSHQAPPTVGPWKSNNAGSGSAHRPSIQHRHLYQHSHYYYPPYSQKKRTSLKSDPSRRSSASTEGNNNDSLLPSATSSTNINEQQQQNRHMSYQTRSRGSSTSIQHPSILGDDSVTSIHPLSQVPSLVPRADPEKHCFLIMIMDVDRLVVYAYNWTEQHSTRIFNRFFSVVHQQYMRSHILNGILHQKMGLFHHSLPFDDVAKQYIASSVVSGGGLQEKSLVPSHGGYSSATVATTPTKAAADDGSSKCRPSLKKTRSELKVITQHNAIATPSTTTMSTPTTPRNWTAADMSIQNVISMDLPLTTAIISTPRSNTNRYRLSEGRLSTSPSTPKKKEKGKKQKNQRRAWSFGGGGATKLDPLSLANPDLGYVLMDAISEPVHAPQHRMLKWKGMRYSVNDDLLRRHGDPYLDTYLQHATVVSVHRKALQVYLKWRKRFGVSGEGVSTPLEASPVSDTSGQQQQQQDEKLTRYEVFEILRSSRLLHFCRAPFFFFTGTTTTDAADGEDQKVHEQDVSENTMDILDWYRQFLRTFVVNYSSYLEKLNLQVVEFAPSEYEELLPLLPSPLLNATENGSRHDASLNDNRDGHGDDDEEEENATNTTDENSTHQGEEYDLNTSKFDTGIHGLTVEHPSTYLLKVSDAGSIICEVRFTHTFVSVSLYGLHRQNGIFSRFLSGLSRQQSREAKRLHMKKFEQGVGQLKHLIHINSFVYDFHLYYMQHLLIQMHQQQCSDASLTTAILPPLGISLMSTLRRFHSFYVTPTHYSTNRLFSGVYECKHHLGRRQRPYVDLNHFFKYLYKDHASYGLDGVIDQHISRSSSNITGVYLTSNSVSFDPISSSNNSKEKEPAWKYTLILCPMTENTLRSSTLDQNPQESPASVTATSVLIRYFILAVYQPERTPSSLAKNFWTTPTASSSYHPSLIVNARNKIDDIVSKVIKTCKQRFSWRAMLPPGLLSGGDHYRRDHQIDRMMDGTQYYSLVSKFQSFSLLSGDNMEYNLARLISVKKDIPWHKMFDMFLRLHHSQCGSFLYKMHHHLLFYHPTHYMDFLLHISILSEEEAEAEDDRIEIKLVRREPRFTDPHHRILSLTPVEQDHVAQLGQSLCYILWEFAKN